MKFQKLIILLFVVSVTLVVVVSVPNLKKSVKEFFLDHKRIILAKVQGEVTSGGSRFVILKIKQDEEIFIEVYSEEEKSENLNFFQKLSVPEKNEGSFTYKGEITNLAFADVDEDNYMEILVPAFSMDMTPRLHTYKYNTATNQFEAVAQTP